MQTSQDGGERVLDELQGIMRQPASASVHRRRFCGSHSRATRSGATPGRMRPAFPCACPTPHQAMTHARALGGTSEIGRRKSRVARSERDGRSGDSAGHPGHSAAVCQPVGRRQPCSAEGHAAAADLEATTEKSAVTPGPPRLRAELRRMLMAASQPAGARRVRNESEGRTVVGMAPGAP
jgi:hypothetical protein